MTIYAKSDASCKIAKRLSSLKKKLSNFLETKTPLFIAVGYAGEAGLDWLCQVGSIIPNSNRLFIGMAVEGLTAGQVDLLQKLKGLGWEIRFPKSANHCKVYLALDKDWGSVGSSNLDSLIKNDKQEVEAEIKGKDVLDAFDLLSSWWDRAIGLDEWLQSPLFKTGIRIS